MRHVPTMFLMRLLTAALAAVVGSVVALAVHPFAGGATDALAAGRAIWGGCGAAIGLVVGLCCGSRTAIGGAAWTVLGLAAFVAMGALIGWGWAGLDVASRDVPEIHTEHPTSEGREEVVQPRDFRPQVVEPDVQRLFPDHPLGSPLRPPDLKGTGK